METSAPCCATCASTSISKAGHNGSGTQQYLCKACGAHRVLVARGPAIDLERKATLLRAVEFERLSLRAAERVFGVARQTVARWLEKKAEDLPPLSETLLPAQKGDVLELDELWSFAGSKVNPRWVWVALCRQTRQVVACFVGDRSADSARALRERIPPDYRCRATRSDFWLAYDEVFPRRTHRCTGKEGETCHVERWNNTLRQRGGPLRAQNALLLPVRPDARSGFALVRPPLQPFTRSLTTTNFSYYCRSTPCNMTAVDLSRL